MIKLIYGAKGSGKTKRIIDMANDNIEVAHGYIVFITDTNRYMYDIRYQIRAINVVEHNIVDVDGLVGFVKGLIAGNQDIKTIYIDGAHRITKQEINDMADFYKEIEGIATNQNVEFVLSVSKDLEELPDFLRKYLN